jgi:hypothetical protein
MARGGLATGVGRLRSFRSSWSRGTGTPAGYLTPILPDEDELASSDSGDDENGGYDEREAAPTHERCIVCAEPLVGVGETRIGV